MKYILIIIIGMHSFIGFGQIDGKQIFKVNCASCHTIGKGKLVGPDLKDVLQRREENWLRKFIKSSTAMVAEGDSVATALFQEYNFIPMPNQTISEEEISAVLNYLSEDLEQKKVATNQIQKKEKTPKSSNSQKVWFEELISEPRNWLAATIFLVMITILFSMLNVIKVLSQKIIMLEKKDKLSDKG